MYGFLFILVGKELLEIGNKKLAQGLDKKKHPGAISQQKTMLIQVYQYR